MAALKPKANNRKEIQSNIYIYIYIYNIYTNLISTSIHGTEKKKKTLARNKRKKYLESPPRGKRKKFWVKKKEKANLVRPLEKNQGIRSQWSKENQKPSANPAMLQLLKCSTPDNGANYKISLNRESKIIY